MSASREIQLYPRFEAIDRAVREGGWKIVALLRLSPAVPFTLQNYLYGLTGIRFWPYLLTSWLAMLPGTFLYIYLGHLGRAGVEAASGERSRTPAEWAMMIVGLLATVAATVYITRLRARRCGSDGGGREKSGRTDRAATLAVGRDDSRRCGAGHACGRCFRANVRPRLGRSAAE